MVARNPRWSRRWRWRTEEPTTKPNPGLITPRISFIHGWFKLFVWITHEGHPWRLRWESGIAVLTARLASPVSIHWYSILLSIAPRSSPWTRLRIKIVHVRATRTVRRATFRLSIVTHSMLTKRTIAVLRSEDLCLTKMFYYLVWIHVLFASIKSSSERWNRHTSRPLFIERRCAFHPPQVSVELGYERRWGEVEDEGGFFKDFPISRNRNSLAFSTERLFESTHAPYFFGTAIDIDSLFRGPMKEMWMIFFL